jgi:hypothetical protein
MMYIVNCNGIHNVPPRYVRPPKEVFPYHPNKATKDKWGA